MLIYSIPGCTRHSRCYQRRRCYLCESKKMSEDKSDLMWYMTPPRPSHVVHYGHLSRYHRRIGYPLCFLSISRTYYSAMVLLKFPFVLTSIFTEISDDGIIRRCSITQMACLSPRSLFSATSDIPLDGSIVSLNVINDERIKDQFIIGGSDDGCLAVWTYKYLASKELLMTFSNILFCYLIDRYHFAPDGLCLLPHCTVLPRL